MALPVSGLGFRGTEGTSTCIAQDSTELPWDACACLFGYIQILEL